MYGAIAFFILPRDVRTARYLNSAEKEAILLAHETDRQMTEDREAFSWSGCFSACKEPQTWFMFLQFFCSGGTSYRSCQRGGQADLSVMLYALAFFAPSELTVALRAMTCLS